MSVKNIEKKKLCIDDEEPHLVEFIVEVKTLTSEVFERLLTLYKRWEPVIKPSLLEALQGHDSDKIVHDNKAGLGDVLNKTMDYISSSEHCVFGEIKKQFFRRVYHFLAASLLDALCQERGNSYGVGIQLKMVLTKIEEWARSKIGAEYGTIAYEELEPARQAANVICILNKEELVNSPTTQSTVCPHLRPAHISHLLKAYKPDQFDKEVIPVTVLATLDKQELSYTPNPKTFNPSLMIPLDLSFEMPRIDLSNVALPRLVVDRSGFSFLKSNFGVSTDSKPVEKW